MSACGRFGEDELLRLEQGLPLDDHFASCADCVRAQEEYRALKRRLSTLHEGLAPPRGWEAGVLETESTVLAMTNRSAVVRGEVYAGGRLVAAAQGTLTIVAPRAN